MKLNSDFTKLAGSGVGSGLNCQRGAAEATSSVPSARASDGLELPSPATERTE